MKKLWFKAKHYGWGWYPASWEGWAVIALYLLFVLSIVTMFKETTNQEAFFKVFPLLLLATIGLIYVYYKTGEKPEWRWGKKK